MVKSKYDGSKKYSIKGAGRGMNMVCLSVKREVNPKNSLKSSKIGFKSLILKVLYQKGST
jgi:hypothetical protein